MNKLLTTLFFLFSIFNLWGIKAKPGVLNYYNENGKETKIKLFGDERFNFVTDTAGYLIYPNGKGDFEYVVKTKDNSLRLSGIGVYKPSALSSSRVNIAEVEVSQLSSISSFSNLKRSTKRQSGESGEPKYRYSTSAFPTIGNPHSLVILVEYPDFQFNVDNPQAYFKEFLNGENFTKDGASGSCASYFKTNSSGKFVPTFDVYGPVMLKNKRAYYGSGNEDNACEMVIEAVRHLDPEVDFSVYDHNGDGYVDSVYLIYADKGEADGGPRESVWPYSWELESEGVSLWADGVKFNTYGCSNELQGDGQMEGIGTFTHEFGHVLGLPDLYNTENYADPTTPSQWSLMDSGSYNNDTRTPCNLSSFERYSLGWLVPKEIVGSGDYNLHSLSDYNEAFILTSEEKEDEFFILEYRDKKGWDAYHPASGILIWHIDFRQYFWDENIVNNEKTHQRVELVCADNDKSRNTRKGDPFPGSDNVRSFTKATIPALLSHKGNELNVTALTRIGGDGEKAWFTAEVTEFRGDSGISDTELNDNIFIEVREIKARYQAEDIYDISGRLVGIATPDKPLLLDKGVYIINHKKVYLK